MSNVGRAIVKKLAVKFEGNEIMSMDDFDVFACYQDLWKTKSEKRNAIRQGPGGTYILRGQGGLDLTSSLEAKFGSKSDQVRQIRRKTWEILLPQDTKDGKKSQFWGQISNSEGKIWGICHPYFWRQTLGP